MPSKGFRYPRNASSSIWKTAAEICRNILIIPLFFLQTLESSWISTDFQDFNPKSRDFQVICPSVFQIFRLGIWVGPRVFLLDENRTGFCVTTKLCAQSKECPKRRGSHTPARFAESTVLLRKVGGFKSKFFFWDDHPNRSKLMFLFSLFSPNWRG